jgi:hypothetical protein
VLLKEKALEAKQAKDTLKPSQKSVRGSKIRDSVLEKT